MYASKAEATAVTADRTNTPRRTGRQQQKVLIAAVIEARRSRIEMSRKVKVLV